MTAACWILFLICSLLMGAGLVISLFDAWLGLEIALGAMIAGTLVGEIWLISRWASGARERR